MKSQFFSRIKAEKFIVFFWNFFLLQIISGFTFTNNFRLSTREPSVYSIRSLFTGFLKTTQCCMRTLLKEIIRRLILRRMQLTDLCCDFSYKRKSEKWNFNHWNSPFPILRSFLTTSTIWNSINCIEKILPQRTYFIFSISIWTTWFELSTKTSFIFVNILISTYRSFIFTFIFTRIKCIRNNFDTIINKYRWAKKPTKCQTLTKYFIIHKNMPSLLPPKNPAKRPATTFFSPNHEAWSIRKLKNECNSY
jgi:hypothetical protein